LNGGHGFQGEHPPPGRRQLAAHGCRRGVRQPRCGQAEDVLRGEKKHELPHGDESGFKNTAAASREGHHESAVQNYQFIKYLG